MACASTALIVGGGIAGHSAAISLAQVGIRSDVIEIAHGPLGASLGISGRAADALGELGVYDACYASGTPWPRDSSVGQLLDAAGNLIAPSPPRPDWPGSKMALGVYRPELLKNLEEQAASLGARTERGLSATALEDVADGINVTLSNGEVRRYDFVIGADGIGSRTRSIVFPDAPKPAYAGQMSIRWMAPGPQIQPEGMYVSPAGRLGFYYLPQDYVYVPAVISRPEWVRLSKEEVYETFKGLLESFTAPAIVELRSRLTPESDLICRPFEWILLPGPWFRGRTLLIGDAAHATTAHMGMGGGMALEDAVVLGQCFANAATIEEAFEAFMIRRMPRVRTVVETSVTLSRMEQAKAPPTESRAMMKAAFEAISQPY